MVCTKRQLIAVALCLAVFGANAAAQDPGSDAKAIEGLWSGSWGGGESDGAISQPVIAELFIAGDHIELLGFRNSTRLAGTVRVDTNAKQLQITPVTENDNQPRPQAISFSYSIKGNELTLIDRDRFSISLERVPVAQKPLGNAQVELVEAVGINEDGDLLVTTFTVLRAGKSGAAHYRPRNQSLNLRKATVRLVKESGWESITVHDARKRIRKSTPVVIAYTDVHRPSRRQPHKLWQETGSPEPGSEAVWRTFSQILRPGTLVFILSARENIPQP